MATEATDRATRFLIIGGGMTGHAAATAIREADPAAEIAMLGEEPDRPYARPPLSKGLWLGKSEESVWLKDVPGLSLRLGRRAVALDVAAREVRDDQVTSTATTGSCSPQAVHPGGSPRAGERSSTCGPWQTIGGFERLKAGVWWWEGDL